MQPPTFWQEVTIVSSSVTDFQKKLKPAGFFELMQDVASTHAALLGVGYEALYNQELAWVLSRKKVIFYDYPVMDEKITIQTWPKGLQQKIFFMRDHLVTGSDGRKLAASTSAYVLVSTRARRIVPPGTLDISVPDNHGHSAIPEPLEKIAASDGLTECFTVQARYSAVDIMGHVNNARYIEWISDCFSLDEHAAHRPTWLQINYLNEIKPGESVALLRGQRPHDPEAWYITAVNQTTGSRAFEAELHW